MSLVISNNSILASAVTNTAAPRILSNSLLRATGATVIASNETTGGEHENAWKEGFTYDFWKPGTSGTNTLQVTLESPLASNALGIAAHNLHQVGGVVKMQHSSDGSTWTDSSTAYTVPNSQPLLILYTAQSALYHRLVVTSTGNPIIGVVIFGAALEMKEGIPAPFDPPYLGRDNRYVTERTEGGQFVGKGIIDTGARLAITVRGLTLDWIRDVWDPQVRTLEQYGFFFAARDLDQVGGIAEAEVIYGWADSQPRGRYDTPTHGSVTLRARGIID